MGWMAGLAAARVLWTIALVCIVMGAGPVNGSSPASPFPRGSPSPAPINGSSLAAIFSRGSPSPTPIIRKLNATEKQARIISIEKEIAQRVTQLVAGKNSSVIAAMKPIAAAIISQSITAAADQPQQAAQQQQQPPMMAASEFQKTFAREESSDLLYHFLSGLPSIQEMLDHNFTSLSPELAALKELDSLGNIAWFLRNFVISGDTLLSVQISPQLEITIRQAIEDSMEEVIGVPGSQVFSSATANVTLALQLQGVQWASAANASSSSMHPGLKAIQNALSALTGSFDHGHILVSFANNSSSSSSSGGSSSSLARRLKQQQQQQQQGANQSAVVTALFYGMPPSNASSLLQELSKRCGDPAVTGKTLERSCREVIQQQLVQAGVPVEQKAFGATYARRPKVEVNLAVAVGLTKEQMRAGADVRSLSWLNSTALVSLLAPLNLTAMPQALLSTLNGSALVNGSLSVPGLNLSQIFPFPRPPLPVPVPPQPAAQTGYPAGIIAAIAVTVTVASLALAGVVWLLFNRGLIGPRRAAAEGSETSSDSRPRRRRGRPRVYHSAKYLQAGNQLPPVLVHAEAPPGAAEPPLLPGAVELVSQQQHPRVQLERGDSVMSAAQFEMEEDGEAAESSSSSSSSSRGQDGGEAAAGQGGSEAAAAGASSSGSRKKEQGRRRRSGEGRPRDKLYGSGGSSSSGPAASAAPATLGGGACGSEPGPSGSSGSSSAGSSGIWHREHSWGSGNEAMWEAAAAAAMAADPTGKGKAPMFPRRAPSPFQQQQQQWQWPPQSPFQQQQQQHQGPAYNPEHHQQQLQQHWQRTASGTLIADAAATVLQHKAEPVAAGLPGTAGQGSTTAAGSRSSTREEAVSPPPFSFAAAAAGAGSRGHEAAPGAPPASPVTPVAAAFAAMSEALNRSKRMTTEEGAAAEDGVQPLGQSCWHSSSHYSGFYLAPSEAQAHLQQQGASEGGRESTAGAAAAAAAEQSGAAALRSISGSKPAAVGGFLSPFAAFGGFGSESLQSEGSATAPAVLEAALGSGMLLQSRAASSSQQQQQQQHPQEQQQVHLQQPGQQEQGGTEPSSPSQQQQQQQQQQQEQEPKAHQGPLPSEAAEGSA